MSAPDFELPPIELPFEVASLDGRPTSSDDVARDGGILIMPAAGADEPPIYIPQSALDVNGELTSAILNLIPVIGKAKGLIEAFTGEDLITGKELAWWERALNVAVLIPVPEEEAVEGARVVKILGEMHHAEEAAHGLEIIEKIHTAVEAVHTGVHARHLGEVIRGEH